MRMNGAIMDLSVSSVPSVMQPMRSTPSGVRMADVSSIDCLKTSRAMRLFPMPNHWLPIPEKMNHVSRGLLEHFYKKIKLIEFTKASVRFNRFLQPP